MKAALVLLLASLFLGTADAGQRRRAPRRTPPPQTKPAPKAPVIGSQVVILTKTGDRISGEVVDINAFSIKIRSSRLESAIALETLASISFDQTPVPAARQQQPPASVQQNFIRDADSAAKALTAMASEVRGGVDYSGYGRQLTELRRAAELFIEKYSTTENSAEARAVALIAGALTDYTWARTIWTLKLGRTSDGSIGAADSPVIMDVLAVYPEFRTAAGVSGDRLAADKLIGGLWKKAEDKASKIHSSIGQSD